MGTTFIVGQEEVSSFNGIHKWNGSELLGSEIKWNTLTDGVEELLEQGVRIYSRHSALSDKRKETLGGQHCISTANIVSILAYSKLFNEY